MSQHRSRLRHNITRRRREAAGSFDTESEDAAALDLLQRDTFRQLLRTLFAEAREAQEGNARLKEYLDKIEPHLGTLPNPRSNVRIIKGLIFHGNKPYDPTKRSLASKRHRENKRKFYASLNAYEAMAASRPLKPPGANR